MAVTYRSSIYPATLVGGSTITLQQLHGVTVNPGSNKDIIIPGGSIDPSAVPMVYADPRVSLATYDLVTALGVSITAGFSITGASLIQYQARTHNATFEGSTSHTLLTINKGFAMISGISASQDGPAECGLTVFPLYDGTNYPLLATTSQSLTSTPTFTSKFGLGPVTVNGTALNGVTAVSIDPGINYVPNRQDGDVFARVGAIYTRMPSISITLTDMASVGTVGSMFNACLAGTIACYFSKYNGCTGFRVANATTSHCKVSAAAGAWSPESLSVANNDDGSVTMRVQVTGTIAAVTNSALP